MRFFLLFLSSLLSANCFAGEKELYEKAKFNLVGEVLTVFDGDTIEIKTKRGRHYNIRFSDMDTPETSKKKTESRRFRPGQKGAREATEKLKKLLPKGSVIRAHCYEFDSYDRPVCHIFNQGYNINLTMIKSGWAMLPFQDKWIRDNNSKRVEEFAKRNKAGLWADDNPTHPATWRWECWRKRKCNGAVNWPDKP